MKNQNLLNRITTLEHDNQEKIQGKQFQKFLNSLPEEDRKRFGGCPRGVMIFRGLREDFDRIMKPYEGTRNKMLIDSIPYIIHRTIQE
jgi:hypothetical protein